MNLTSNKRNLNKAGKTYNFVVKGLQVQNIPLTKHMRNLLAHNCLLLI